MDGLHTARGNLEHRHVRNGRRIMFSDANPHVVPPSSTNSQYTATSLAGCATTGENDVTFMYSRSVQRQTSMADQTQSSSSLLQITGAQDTEWAPNLIPTLCFSSRLSPGDWGTLIPFCLPWTRPRSSLDFPRSGGSEAPKMRSSCYQSKSCF